MNRRWTSEHEQQLLQLRATGLTWRAIAKKVGRSEASVMTRIAIMKARVEKPNDQSPFEPLAGGPGLH